MAAAHLLVVIENAPRVAECLLAGLAFTYIFGVKIPLAMLG